MINIDLSFERQSEVSVSERGEKKDGGGYRSNYLVATVAGAEIRFDVTSETDAGEPSFQIIAAFYHVENAETGRAFHSHLTVPLERSDLEELRQFVELALAIAPEPDETG